MVHTYTISNARSQYGGDFSIGLVRFDDNEANVNERDDSYLSESELKQLAYFKSAIRDRTFRLGRRAVKRALAHLFSGVDASNWDVSPNVHGAPVVACLTNVQPPIHVSISHTDRAAVGLVTSRLWPAAIDLEEVVPRNEALLLDYVTLSEKRFIESQLEVLPVVALTMLWSVKESLAKLLESGLSAQINVYETTDWTFDSEGRLSVKFINFSHVQACSASAKGHVLSISYPLPSEITSAGLTLLISELTKLS
jgi:phosphopantetheinyl transferase